MPSKLGPHFIGAPGFERWLAAGARVMKFDPTSLGVSDRVSDRISDRISDHVPADSGVLVVGKLDQESDTEANRLEGAHEPRRVAGRGRP